MRSSDGLKNRADALGGRVLHQDFDGNRLAVAINELLVAHPKACFLQQPGSFPRKLARTASDCRQPG